MSIGLAVSWAKLHLPCALRPRAAERRQRPRTRIFSSPVRKSPVVVRHYRTTSNKLLRIGSITSRSMLAATVWSIFASVLHWACSVLEVVRPIPPEGGGTGHGTSGSLSVRRPSTRKTPRRSGPNSCELEAKVEELYGFFGVAAERIAFDVPPFPGVEFIAVLTVAQPIVVNSDLRPGSDGHIVDQSP